MKKTLVAVFVAIISIASIAFVSVNEVQAIESNVETQGAGDGHCTKCGLKNGRYRCPSFVPISGAHKTDCKCGHAKSSHAFR